MNCLVVFLTTGKGTWAEAYKVINGFEWDKVIILTNDFGSERLSSKENTEIIVVKADSTSGLVEEFKKVLEPRIRSCEVAVNITSGSGKEHAALISAIIRLGLPLRLVVFENESLVTL